MRMKRVPVFGWRLTPEDVDRWRLTAEDMAAMLITPEDLAAMQSGRHRIDLVNAAAGRPGKIQRIAAALLAGQFEKAAALSPNYSRRPPPDDDDPA
jgi:hypothetical protein